MSRVKVFLVQITSSWINFCQSTVDHQRYKSETRKFVNSRGNGSNIVDTFGYSLNKLLIKKINEKMIFGDKFIQSGLSDNESSKRMEKSSNHLEPFSFSALHFLRNRLLPSGNYDYKEEH